MTDKVLIAVASSVISSLLNNISNRALNELKCVGGFYYVQFRLRQIQKYLTNTHNFQAHEVREIERVGYRAADIIERMIWLQQQRKQQTRCIDALPRYYHALVNQITLYTIGCDLNQLNQLIPGIFDRNIPNSSNSGESSSTVNDQFENHLSEDPRRNIYIGGHDEVVGFDNLTRDIIKDQLESPFKELSVVSIFGMGGIGKSTLAKKVFDAAENFPIKIWITLSRKFDVLNLRKKILSDAFKIKDEDLKKMTDEEVNSSLQKYLEEKRYLIVLDDIWEKESWDAMYFDCDSSQGDNPRVSILPDKRNRSRIILTTRKQSVAGHPELYKFEHEVKPLGDDEGLKLLKSRAFPSYMREIQNKNELERLAPELAQKCRGLPLALVVLGGYLSKHLNYQTWLRMSRDVDWDEAGDEIDIKKILKMSYDDLPEELKPLFLYITIFSEDFIIKSSDLIELWVAEGLVPNSRKHKPEMTAQLCLDQLYERSLIQVVEWSRAHERISAIRIHDVLRDWGIETTEKEGFFNVINGNGISTDSAGHIPCRAAFDSYWDQSRATSMPHLRTLLGFMLPEDQISFGGLLSLRVLSFNRIPTKGNMVPRLVTNVDFVKDMIFLRHICLRNYGNFELPSSIGQLSNLQTLDCRDSYVCFLPSSLWEITTLRHVYLGTLKCEWCGPKKGFGKNLQTLAISSINMDHSDWDGVAEALEEMNQIVRLDLYFGISSLPENILSQINHLFCLEVLKLSLVEGLTKIPDGTFPKNLVKVVLDCQELKKDPMPVFQKLDQLVLLKLYLNLHLNSLHCSVGGFPRLKYLGLYDFENLKKWTVDNFKAMPSLFHVKLQCCENLELFPEKLMDHNQLQLLEVVEMPKLSGADYNKLENKESKCKVIIAESRNDIRLSDLR